MRGDADGGPPPQAPVADSLRLSLQAPDRVRTGDAVPLTLRVENVSGRPLDLYLRGRTIAFDVVVTDEREQPVWSRLHDEILPGILRVESMAPGDVLVLEDRWEQRTDGDAPVAPGIYRVEGLLLTEGEPLRTPSRFLVVDPGGAGDG